MEISKEEVKAWRMDLVTAEVMARGEKELREAADFMADGSTIKDEPGDTAQTTAFWAGYIRGLKWFLEVEGDETEEKKDG